MASLPVFCPRAIDFLLFLHSDSPCRQNYDIKKLRCFVPCDRMLLVFGFSFSLFFFFTFLCFFSFWVDCLFLKVLYWSTIVFYLLLTNLKSLQLTILDKQKFPAAERANDFSVFNNNKYNKLVCRTFFNYFLPLRRLYPHFCL